MIMRRILTLIALVSTPLAAQTSDPLLPTQPDGEDRPILTTPEPLVTSPVTPVARALVVPKDWRGVFATLRAADWPSAKAGIDSLADHPLKPVARAELYTAKGSPTASAAEIVALLVEAPDLPKAAQLQRLAAARGVAELPAIAPSYRIVPLTSAPRRHRSRPVRGDLAADAMRLALEPMVKSDLGPEAEAIFLAGAERLTPEGRAEMAQRVAWIYYVLGRDADARRIAELGIATESGEWATQAHWIAGLAAWRMDDCESASRHFRGVASGRAESELAAAGAFWAARAEQACRRPGQVDNLLRVAAKSSESFYGLLARETLGIASAPPRAARAPASIERLSNVKRAAQLAAIGERGLAEEAIRHQARIGSRNDHAALAAKARELDLHGAAYWLAHNGQAGSQMTTTDRFPLPRWAPTAGWRIDPALAWAHARQESDFRSAAVSPAGAVGLMQVRPGTAGDIARQRGTALGNLADPATNVEYGQSYIELVRRNAATQGQILKIMAAYNAGPVPVSRWNYLNDKGDPLLWIESLPYWETRYYVPAVMRNLWVYQQLAGTPPKSLKELAQRQWPSFPSPPSR
jgi:soluble lytic murein transglycosylase-like protein